MVTGSQDFASMLLFYMLHAVLIISSDDHDIIHWHILTAALLQIQLLAPAASAAFTLSAGCDAQGFLHGVSTTFVLCKAGLQAHATVLDCTSS